MCNACIYRVAVKGIWNEMVMKQVLTLPHWVPLFESEVNKNLLIQHKQPLETKFMINDSKKIKGTSNQLNVFCFKQD